MRDYSRNAEGYKDTTAYEAIRRAESPPPAVRKTIGMMLAIARIMGFSVVSHIELEDVNTGRKW